MCGTDSSKPEKHIPVTRDSFPEPDLPAWQQVFSERHRRQFALNALQGLEDEVHPVFSRTNFSSLNAVTGVEQPISTWLDPVHTMPQMWYERIRPALTLATELLHFSSDFFNTVLYGEVERHTVSGDRVEMVYSRKVVEPRSRFTTDLGNLSNIQFFCGPYSEWADSFGVTMTQVYPKSQTQNMATVAIQVNNALAAFFARQNYDTLPQELKDKILVVLGVTLVHELVHAWFAFRRYEVARTGGDEYSSNLCDKMAGKEPYFYHNEEHNELGFSWEQFAFGGRLDVYDTDGKVIHNTMEGLRKTALIAVTGVTKDCDPTRSSFLKARLVGALLNRKCWDEFSVLFGIKRGAEHLPLVSYANLGGGILTQMEMVVALRKLQDARGRLPTAKELSLEIVRALLIATVSGHKIEKPWAVEFSTTPPQTPSSEDLEECPPSSPSTTSSEADVEPEVDSVSAWQTFASANKKAALKSGYLRA